MNNIIYYSENPSLENEGMRVVVTFDGQKEYRINCKLINGQFYVKNKQCFLVDGKWHRIDSGLIFFDHELKQWLKEKDKGRYPLIKGIVDIQKGSYTYGYFSPNPLNNVVAVINGGMSKMTVLNPELLYDNGFVEDVSRGLFFPKSDLTYSSLKEFSTPSNKISSQAKGYNIEDNEAEFDLKIQLFQSYKMPLSKDVRRFGKFLEDTTIGIELETIKGYLPDFQQYRTGTVICRDGSLKASDGTQGSEFVTVPMYGAKCLQNIVNLCTELSKRTEIDTNCSYHIHLGNIRKDRLFLVALYMLCFKIQDELFEMLPYYKTDPSGVKEKNYNKKLRKLSMFKLNAFDKDSYNAYINSAYQRIFVFLTEGSEPGKKFNRKNKMHPAGNQKWNKHSRYYWINFINIFFSERNTIEFRPHHGTLNSQKAVNWLFIVNAIIKYASLHEKDIITTGKKISLSQVLNYYGEHFKTPKAQFLSEYLIAYLEDRKKLFKNDFERGDYISKHEITKDLNYTFKYNGCTNLF